MEEYDNWVSRLFDVDEEGETLFKEGVTSNGIPFDLSIDTNRWGKTSIILNLKFNDCAEPKKKSLVHIVDRDRLNLYHTLNYIMHCESNADVGQQRYEEYKTAFDVARHLLEEFFHKGYDTYNVYISDEQECGVTVCADFYKVSLTFDLRAKKVALGFSPIDDTHEAYIAYPMSMMISYSELIEALKKDYYGECESCDEEEEEEDDEDDEEEEE